MKQLKNFAIVAGITMCLSFIFKFTKITPNNIGTFVADIATTAASFIEWMIEALSAL